MATRLGSRRRLTQRPRKQPPQWNERARRFGGLFAGAFSARPRCARRRPGGLPQGFHRRNDRGMVVYFDFFGTRFLGLGPDRPDGSASSPWHGQASLKASKARVMPGKFNRSGFWSRYRNRTLALSKMLPSAGGHARTSGGRFGEKNMAVSIIPSHAPADRASTLS